MAALDADHPLLKHASHEVPKAFPGIALILGWHLLDLPWAQIGYMLGVVLIVVQISYSVWKWRREAKEDRRPPVHVPPSSDG